jgi:iron complex transport system substrate-binding protein
MGPVFSQSNLPKRIVVLSSVFAGFIEALGAVQSIVGVDRIVYYSHPEILKAFQENKIVELGEESQINEQLLYTMKPDLIVSSSSILKQSALIERCKTLSIPILICDNYLEQDPLARAEWIKVFGIVLGKTRIANQLFDSVVTNYNALKQQNLSLVNKPKVLTDALYSDAWNVPGGNSYTAQLIADAGGDYIFKSFAQRFSYAFNLEKVIRLASDADIWINMNRYSSKRALLGADSRYQMFKAFQLGQLFNNHKRELPSGANDFWEIGPVRPDWVLHDLTWIMAHPNISSDKLFFYQKLE